MKEAANLKKVGVWRVILPIIAALFSAVLGALYTEPSSAWYQTLVKPAFLPVPLVYTVAWAAAYVLIAISAVIIALSEKPGANSALILFGASLTLNAFWSFMVFYIQYLMGALIALFVLIISITALMRSCYRIEKIAAYLLAPYLVWVLFLTALNYTLAMLN